MTRNKLTRLAVVAALPAMLLIAGACGSDDDDDSPSATNTVVTERTPTSSPSKSTTSGAITLTNPTTTATGLKYEDVVVGTGKSPQTGQRVTVHYTGTFTNGTKFDSSRDRGQPFTFVIGNGNVIKGWDEATAMLKVGSKARVTIPPELGYGRRAMGPIPANATLVFDVELVSAE